MDKFEGNWAWEVRGGHFKPNQIVTNMAPDCVNGVPPTFKWRILPEL